MPRMRYSACNRKREATCVARFGKTRMILNDGSLTSTRPLRVGEEELVYVSIPPRDCFRLMAFVKIADYRLDLRAAY
jgi:hypothetical protein